MMKAIVRRRWGRARDVVELADVPKPEPAVDEVLVHVRASSVNRSDYYVLGGAAILMRPMIGGFLRPKDERLGGDFAGIAEAGYRYVELSAVPGWTEHVDVHADPAATRAQLERYGLPSEKTTGALETI